jgi:hypothetical protein
MEISSEVALGFAARFLAQSFQLSRVIVTPKAAAELPNLFESRQRDVWIALLNADPVEELPSISDMFTEHPIPFYFPAASWLFCVRELPNSEAARRRVSLEFSNLEKLGRRSVVLPIVLVKRPPQYPGQKVDVSDWALVKRRADQRGIDWMDLLRDEPDQKFVERALNGQLYELDVEHFEFDQLANLLVLIEAYRRFSRLLSAVKEIAIRSSVEELFGGVLGIPSGSVRAAKFGKIAMDCESRIRALSFDSDSFAFPVLAALMNRVDGRSSSVSKLMRSFSSFSWSFGVTRVPDDAGFHAIRDELAWLQKLLEWIPEFSPGDRLLRFVELVKLIEGTRLILAEVGINVSEEMILEALVTDQNRKAVVAAIAETNEACKPLRKEQIRCAADRLDKFGLLLAWTMRMLEENPKFLREWGEAVSEH